MIRVYRDKRETAPLSGGEANVGANVGASGIGPYDSKTSTTLNFRKANLANGVKATLNGQQIDHELDLHGITTVESPTVTQDYMGFSDESAAGDPTKRQLIQTVWNLGLLTYLTAQGHMLYRGAASTPAGLAIGTAGQLMVVNPGATAPSWATAKRVLQLLAVAGKPTQTSGCGDLASAETTTHAVNYDYLPFDDTSAENAYWPFFALTNWNAGTVTYRVQWTAASGASNGVAWVLKGLALSDSDPIDTAHGSGITVIDTLDTAGDLQWSPWSSVLTVGNTPSAGDAIQFQLQRNTAHESDDLADDARLLGIELLYTTSSYTDG